MRCPKCHSIHVENQLSETKRATITYSVCQNCGYTWEVDHKKKKSNSGWWGLLVLVILFVIVYNSIDHDLNTEFHGKGNSNDLSVSNKYINVSLMESTRSKTVGEGWSKQTAKNGKVFLIVFFEAENKSDKEKAFGSYYIKGYSDNYLVEKSYLLSDIDGYSYTFGNVAPGKKIKFYCAWEVDENYKEFDIYIKDNIWDDAQPAFTITRKDLLTETTTIEK